MLKKEEEQLKKEARERERQKTEEQSKRLKRKIAMERFKIIMESEPGGKAQIREITEEQLDQFDADNVMEKKVCHFLLLLLCHHKRLPACVMGSG